MSPRNTRPAFFLVLAAVAILGMTILATTIGFPHPTAGSPGQQSSEKRRSTGPHDEGRPADRTSATVESPAASTSGHALPSASGSAAPSRDARAAAQIASVVEAARDGRNPERLTPLIAPKPFDRRSYDADPSAYLNETEPGRPFVTAAPGKDVPRLSAVGGSGFAILPGGQVTLVVKGVPRAPISLTSFGLGAFANGLTSTTVQADDQGLASVIFTATPGTINEVPILAGSPMSMGNVRFSILVRENKPR